MKLKNNMSNIKKIARHLFKHECGKTYSSKEIKNLKETKKGVKRCWECKGSFEFKIENPQELIQVNSKKGKGRKTKGKKNVMKIPSWIKVNSKVKLNREKLFGADKENKECSFEEIHRQEAFYKNDGLLPYKIRKGLLFEVPNQELIEEVNRRCLNIEIKLSSRNRNG